MSGRRLLRNYLDLEEAVVVRSRLQAEGFDAILENEVLHTANPALRFALGCRLLISDAEGVAADAFLKELEVGPPQLEAEVCKTCGGQTRRGRSLLWAAVGFLHAVPYTRETGVSVCRNCGAKVHLRGPLASSWALLLAIGLLALAFLFGAGSFSWYLTP